MTNRDPICPLLDSLLRLPNFSSWTDEQWAAHEAIIASGWWDPPNPADPHDEDWWEWYNNWYAWMHRYKKYYNILGTGVDDCYEPGERG